MSKKQRDTSELWLLYPKPSPSMRWAGMVLHLVAGVALWLAALPWWVLWMGSAGLMFSAWWHWRKPLAVRGVQWGRDGAWQLALPHGAWVAAHLDASRSRSWPWWVVLDFRLDDGRRLGVTLAVDSLSKDEFRHLRARLKIKAGALAGDV